MSFNPASIQALQSLAGKLKGQRVLVREDLNVPLDEAKHITDDTRITETLATLEFLIKEGARVVVVSHFGRPKGKINPEFSLQPVANHLKTLLPQANVQLAPALVGPEVQAQINALQNGQLLLLENSRFEPGEEANSPELSAQLASLVDVYVNDAFGTAHRAHATTEGVTRAMTAQNKPVVAGFLMLKELEALGGVLDNPTRPFTAIIGGSKVSSKISVLTHLLNKVDTLIVGGGMAYTFLLAQGYSVGNSLCEPDFVKTAKEIMSKAQTQGVKLLLSEDLIVADAFSPTANTQTVNAHNIPDGWEGVDIGPKSRQAMTEAILASKTVLWNGPVGVFEMDAFAGGTRAVADAVVKATQAGAKTVLGGGDTVAAIEKFGLPKTSFTHVSTGGGASLEFLEGKTLPGVAALQAASQPATCSV